MSAVSMPIPMTRAKRRHRLRFFVRRLFQSFKTGGLYLANLAFDKMQPGQIATHLGQGIWRQGCALGSAQGREKLRRSLQRWLEPSDPEPGQTTLHPIDNPRALGDQALALTVWTSAVFFLDCRDSRHVAVISFTAKEGPLDLPRFSGEGLAQSAAIFSN